MTPKQVNDALHHLTVDLLKPEIEVTVNSSDLCTLIAAYRQRRSEAEDALRSLTPGGSEFQTVRECLDYIKDLINRQHDHIVRLMKER